MPDVIARISLPDVGAPRALQAFPVLAELEVVGTNRALRERGIVMRRRQFKRSAALPPPDQLSTKQRGRGLVGFSRNGRRGLLHRSVELRHFLRQRPEDHESAVRHERCWRSLDGADFRKVCRGEFLFFVSKQEFARPKQILSWLALIFILPKLRHKRRIGIEPPANTGLRKAIGVTEMLMTQEWIRPNRCE